MSKEIIILNKHSEGAFTLPCVVDYIDFVDNAAIDVIQLKSELFKKDQPLQYNGNTYAVVKKLKSYPVQTETKLENRLEILKVRYYCEKLKQ